MYTDAALADGLSAAQSTLDEQLKALADEVDGRGVSVRLGCGGKARGRKRAGCLVLVVALAVYVGSAALAAAALAGGMTATLKIRRTQHLCGSSMLVTADLQATNPSSWAASLDVQDFFVRDKFGAVMLHAGAGAITPAVLRLPPGATVRIPLTLDLKFTDEPAMGAMLHQTYTGTIDMTMGLAYSGGLDMFPYTVEGTMVILVKTNPPKPDADGSPAAPPTRPAGPAGPAAGGAGETAGVDKVVTVDALRFSSEILSADQPIIEDTATGFAVSTKLTVSASWVICLMLHTFQLPSVRLVARSETVSEVSSDGGAVGTVVVTRYALPASYQPKTTENSVLEVWVRAEVLASQTGAARSFATLLLSDNETAIPLTVGVDAGDCAALRCLDAMVGQMALNISSLFATGHRFGTGAGGAGGTSPSTVGLRNQSVAQMIDLVGVILPGPEPVDLRFLPQSGTGLRVAGAVLFRNGSLVETVLRTLSGLTVEQTVPDEPTLRITSTLALGETRWTNTNLSEVSAELTVGLSVPEVTAVIQTVLHQAAPAISNGDPVAMEELLRRYQPRQDTAQRWWLPGAWQMTLAADAKEGSTLSQLLDGIVVRLPRQPTVPRRRRLQADPPSLPHFQTLTRRPDDTTNVLRLEVDWTGGSVSNSWPVVLTSAIGVRLYAATDPGVKPVPRTVETLAVEASLHGGALFSATWLGDVTLWNTHGLEALGSQSVLWSHRDAPLAVSVEILLGANGDSLDDGAATVVPVDVLLPQSEALCWKDAGHRASEPAPPPPSHGILGFGRPPPPPPPPPPRAGADPNAGEDPDSYRPVLVHGLMLADRIAVSTSAFLSTVEASARLYNPLDLGLVLIEMRMPLRKVDRVLSRSTGEEVVTTETVGTPGHFQPAGHVVLAPHSEAVDATISFGIDHMTDFMSPSSMEINLDHGLIRLAIGDFPSNSIVYTLSLSVPDIYGMRCHGLNVTAEQPSSGTPPGSGPPPPAKPSRPPPLPPPPVDPICPTGAPVVHGSSCNTSAAMAQCTVQCLDGYRLHAGMHALYMCYSGTWIPALGPLTCTAATSPPPPVPDASACGASAPVEHGSGCGASAEMGACTVQCLDGYGSRPGLSAGYVCYAGGWMPQLGPLACVGAVVAPPPPPKGPRPPPPPPPPCVGTSCCEAGAPVEHGSGCDPSAEMGACTVQCLDGYGSRPGLSAGYMCYAGGWMPQLGPLVCS